VSRWSSANKVAIVITIGGALISSAVWLGSRVHAAPTKTVVTVTATTRPSYGEATTIVLDVDVTASVTAAFVRQAQHAFAAAVVRIVRDGQGPIRVYLRVISHSSGSDAAAVATYTIPAVPTCSNNPFDLRCRRAHDAALANAHARARMIATNIEQLHLKRTSTGTALRGAFAAAGQLLVDAQGRRWLVAATDLRPSNAPPSTENIDLHGVRVVILFACEQSIAQCQSRRAYWDAELRRDGASTVAFLTPQQSDLLFAGGGN